MTDGTLILLQRKERELAEAQESQRQVQAELGQQRAQLEQVDVSRQARAGRPGLTRAQQQKLRQQVGEIESEFAKRQQQIEVRQEQINVFERRGIGAIRDFLRRRAERSSQEEIRAGITGTRKGLFDLDPKELTEFIEQGKEKGFIVTSTGEVLDVLSRETATPIEILLKQSFPQDIRDLPPTTPGEQILQSLQTPQIIQQPKELTKFQKFRQRIRDVETIEEQQRDIARGKPLKELVVSDLPTGVRQLFTRGGEKLLGAVDVSRVTLTGGEPISKESKQFGGRILGETALFVGVSPLTPTTTQLERLLATETQVLFKGVQAFPERNVIQTDIRFLTSGGEKGVARGISKVFSEGDFVLSKTLVAGRSGRFGLELPVGKIKFIKQKSFGGLQTGIGKKSINVLEFDVKNVGRISKEIDIFESFSAEKILFRPGKKLAKTRFGKFKPRRATKIQRSISKGTAFDLSKKEIGIVSKTLSDVGSAKSVGIITKLPQRPPKFDVSSITKQSGVQNLLKVEQQAQQLAVQDVTSQVAKQFIKPLSIPADITRAVVPIIKKPISKAVTQKVTTPRATTTPATAFEKQILNQSFQTQTDSALIKDIQRNLVGFDTAVAVRQRDRQLVAQATKQETRQRQKLKTLQRQRQEQRQRQRQRLKTTQRQRIIIRQTFGIPIPPKIRFPKLLIPAFTLLKGKGKKGRKGERGFLDDSLLISEGLTAQVTGIKEFIKEKDLLKVARRRTRPGSLQATPFLIPTKRKKRKRK